MAAYTRTYQSGGSFVISAIANSATNLIESPACHVNRLFLPVKLTYFLYWAGMSSLLPFLPVYMSYLGLSSIQTGIIRGVEPFLDFLIAPLWGAIADKYSKHRFVLLLTMIVSGLFYSSTYFIPAIKQQEEWTPLTNSTPINLRDKFSLIMDEKQCPDDIDESNNQWQTFSRNLVSKGQEIISVECLKQDSFKSIKEYSCCRYVSDDDLLISNQIDQTSKILNFHMEKETILTFSLMTILIFGAKSFLCTTGPILDAVAMALSEEHNSDFGRQRVWGGITWGLFGAISGACIDACNKYCQPKYVYAPAFILFAIFVLLAVITTCQMQFHTHQTPSSISRNICTLFTNPDMLIFLLILFIIGVAVGVISTYLFLFLQQQQSPHSLMGLTLTISCVSEVPFMFYSSKILDYFGHKGIFYLCLLCYALRLGGYSLLYNPWMVLPIELLHGVCYGAFWPTLTSYSSLLAPDGMEATVQTIAFAVNCGFGEGIGTLVGGVIYHIYGARFLFRASAAMCAVTLIVCLLLHWCMKCVRTTTYRRLHVQYESI